MSNIVIKIENVSKLYRLGKIGTGSFKHDLNRWWHTVRGKEDPYLKIGEKNDRTKTGGSEYVWALKDVSFDLKQGEVLGIIGRNGAGKSTLLKILSRTTLPTSGNIKIKGRVASLLEVGTGFHPELTGRENIFLNGAILGMSKNEIKRKYDEIVDFSGVERYIDTPVKRYSSGMYVRLAFGVAAHLEPEVLIVDEVLAVGDAEFQSKCIGKMKDVSRNEGRTVLFVSHSIGTIQSLCSKAIFLERGKVGGEGAVEEVVLQYLKTSKPVMKQNLRNRKDRTGSGIIRFTDVTMKNKLGQSLNYFVSGQDVIFTLHCEVQKLANMKNLMIALGINDSYGNRITNLNNEVTNEIFSDVSNEILAIEVSIDKLPLMPGEYDVAIYSRINGEVSDWVQNAFSFTVESGDFFGTGRLIPSGQGSFLVSHRFTLNFSKSVSE